MGANNRHVFVLLAAMMVALAGTQRAAAQTLQAGQDKPEVVRSAEVPRQAAAVERFSIREVMRVGGWLMYVLAGASLVATAVVIYFFFVLRQEQVVPRALRRELAEKIGSGTLTELRNVCLNRPSPLSAVILATLNYLQAVPNADAGLLRDMVQSEGARQAEAIQGQTRYLMDIAAISPMIGLLGTVTGMVKAFRAVASDEVMARPMVLADGVRMALYTTVAGLMIAIPTMMFYAYFREKANALVSHLETMCAETLASLLHKRSR